MNLKIRSKQDRTCTSSITTPVMSSCHLTEVALFWKMKILLRYLYGQVLKQSVVQLECRLQLVNSMSLAL